MFFRIKCKAIRPLLVWYGGSYQCDKVNFNLNITHHQTSWNFSCIFHCLIRLPLRLHCNAPIHTPKYPKPNTYPRAIRCRCMSIFVGECTHIYLRVYCAVHITRNGKHWAAEILSGIFGLLWLDNGNRVDSGPECKAFRVELGRDRL